MSFKKSIIVILRFAFEASCIFEKLFWISLGLIGFVYIVNLLILQVNSWDENAYFVSRASLPLSNIEFPAITFCSRGTSKYAIVERLGNLFDPKNNETKKMILSLRNMLVQHYVKYPLGDTCSKRCVTEHDTLCVFPFIKWDGKVHNKCYEQSKNKFICATKVDKNGKATEDPSGKKYSLCSYNCNLPCTTITYESCLFPFKYKKKIYKKCTTDGGGGLWCATKVNQDGEMESYGNCQNHCKPLTDPLCTVSHNKC